MNWFEARLWLASVFDDSIVHFLRSMRVAVTYQANYLLLANLLSLIAALTMELLLEMPDLKLSSSDEIGELECSLSLDDDDDDDEADDDDESPVGDAVPTAPSV